VTVKVRYRGQTLAQAMASNPVRLQVTVSTTSYQVPVTEQLGDDADDPNYAGHVWQVQALLNGSPYGRNNGLSQIEWFVVAPIEFEQQPWHPFEVNRRSIPVLMWEVPYEEIRPGRPIKLQVPPIQEDTVLYMLRVRVPEKLSLQQLEQLRKNWAHEVRKEISAERTHQDTFVVQSYPPEYYARIIVDSTRRRRSRRWPWDRLWWERLWETELARLMQDTAGAGVDRTRYTGGYFLYALPQDTTKPAELVDYYVPNGTPQDTTEPASAAWSVGPQAQIANQWTKALAGGGGRYAPPLDTIVPTPPPLPARMDAILVMGQFIPTHVGLPMPELELDPGDGPVCDLPAREDTVRHSRVFVVNEAIASGAGPTGKTLGAVTRQAPPQGGNQNMAGPNAFIMPPDRRRMHEETRLDASWRTDRRRMHEETRLDASWRTDRRRMHEETRLDAYRRRMHEETRLDAYAFIMPPGGGAPVLWPNGNPPRDPDWPWVGVIGTPVLEGIDGDSGPGKPQNWCGTEYIWTGPPPKFWLILRPR
jgi:hypothetical protein